jgi:hypothetical protein
MADGIYRDGEMALVRYEGKYDVPVARQLYDGNGHLPLFEALPTREEFERAAEGVVIVGSDGSRT